MIIRRGKSKPNLCIVFQMRWNGREWEAWPAYETRKGSTVTATNPWEAIAKLGTYVYSKRRAGYVSASFARKVSRQHGGKLRISHKGPK